MTTDDGGDRRQRRRRRRPHTGLFFQREGPGSELGNSLWHPDVSLEAAVVLDGVLGAFSVERAYIA